jgi:hypothetical protein
MLGAIPFEMPAIAPFVIMEARVGARDLPVRLLLDTGNAAPYALLISPGLAARAGAAAEAGAAPGTGVGVGDAAIAITGARLASLRLGPIAMRDVAVGVSGALDAASRQLGVAIDGVVGHRFIAGRRISIDYVRRQVDFTAPAGRAEAAIAFTVAPGRPLTLVRVAINGHGPFLMALDSAASTSLLSPASAAAAGVDADQAAQLGGGGGTAAGGARLGRARMTLGSVTRDGQPVAVADIVGPIRAAAGADIDGVLGADFFKTGRITLDYGRNLLWFDEVPETR